MNGSLHKHVRKMPEKEQPSPARQLEELLVASKFKAQQHVNGNGNGSAATLEYSPRALNGSAAAGLSASPSTSTNRALSSNGSSSLPSPVVAAAAADNPSTIPSSSLTTTRRRKSSSTTPHHVYGPLPDVSSLEYTTAALEDLIHAYSNLCAAAKLDDALSLIRGCIKASRADVLGKLLHNRFLRPAATQKAVFQAMRFVQLLPRQYVDARTYNMVLTVCANAGDLRSALQVADMLQAAGLKQDAIIYTNLLKVCAVSGNAEKAFTIAAEVKGAGIRMEKEMYSALVSTCGAAILKSNGDRRAQLVLLERAFNIVKDMISANLPVDTPVWNALVTASGRAGQLQRALSVLEDMLARGCRPNDRTYAALVDACARSGDKDLALRVLKKARREGSANSLLIFSSAINACLKDPRGADLHGAMEVYSELQHAGIDADAAVYGTLILAAGRTGDLQLALQLRDEMLAEDLPADSGTNSALICTFVANDQLKEAMRIYKQTKVRGEKPHLHAMNALIGAHGKIQRLGDVVSLVGDLIDSGLKPDEFTFHAILVGCYECHEHELAIDIYKVMKQRKVKVDEATAFLLLLICYTEIRIMATGHMHSSNSSASQGHGGAISLMAALPMGGHREQERAKLLATLRPRGRQTEAPTYSGDVHWLSQAFNIYREAQGSGIKTSSRMLEMVLMCLRIPWMSGSNKKSRKKQQQIGRGAQGGDGYGALHLQNPPSVSYAGPARVQNQAARIGIEAVYHVQAISILEEAIVGGMVPSFSLDAPVPIDLRSMLPATAEAYTITVIAALQRAVEARRGSQSQIRFLVPVFDGTKVFVPSNVDWTGSTSSGSDDESATTAAAIAGNSRISSLSNVNSNFLATSIDVSEDSEDEYDDDYDLFEIDEDVYSASITAGEKTGLGVAGVLRRLQLWSKEDCDRGLIAIDRKEIIRWSKNVQRMAERRSASALPVQKPYGQAAPHGLLEQQRRIRQQGL
jgi:pentatricopeptide repeat protein